MEKLYFVLPDDFLGQRITQKRVFFYEYPIFGKRGEGGLNVSSEVNSPVFMTFPVTAVLFNEEYCHTYPSYPVT